MHAAVRLPAILAIACCAACSPPVEPPDERPPEPQATALRDAIQAPIDKANAVGDALHDAAERRHGEIDAAEAAPRQAD